MDRRLAAILAADVVGYSRLMGQDEAGTFQALNALRAEVIDPKVAEHKGRIFKTTGDGLLAEFPSVVNAVACAVDIQRGMAGRNADLPEGQAIQLRIGVNLGDVIVEGEDVFGDGVNVASRLEGIAPPGGLIVASTVRDHIGNKLDIEFEDIGPQVFKNIAEPVRCYRFKGIGVPSTAARVSVPSKPSIAVLPFDNMSGDSEQQYFSDGITEDIISQLSRFRSLFVIARNSSFAFKGQAADLREIGRKLGAQYIIEGSVRKAGGRIRITAQLINVVTGSHVWSERFDRGLDDIFAIQDEVTAGIVGKVAGQVQVADIESARRRTGSLTAYDYYLKGLEHVRRGGLEDTVPAIENLSKAIKEDRNFAQAYALLSHAQIVFAMSLWGVDEYLGAIEKALEWAHRSMALDANDARCHAAVGRAYFVKKQFDLAELHVNRALMLNPYDPDIVALQCYLAAYGDSPETALSLIEFAEKLSPMQPNWYYEPWGVALYQLRRYSEAAKVFERAMASQPYALRYLAACYAQLGDLAQARIIAEKSLELQPDFSLQKWLAYEQYKSKAGLIHMYEGLRKAGLPE